MSVCRAIAAVVGTLVATGCFQSAEPTELHGDPDATVELRDAGTLDAAPQDAAGPADAAIDATTSTPPIPSGFDPPSFPTSACLPIDDVRAAQIAVASDGVFVRVEHASDDRAREIVWRSKTAWLPISDADGSPPESRSSTPGGLSVGGARVFENVLYSVGCGLRRLRSPTQVECIAWTGIIPAASFASEVFGYAVSDSSVLEYSSGTSRDVFRASGHPMGPAAPFYSIALGSGGVWLGSAQALSFVRLPSGESTTVASTIEPVTHVAAAIESGLVAYVVGGHAVRLDDGHGRDASAAEPARRCGRSGAGESIRTLGQHEGTTLVQSSTGIWTTSWTRAATVYETPCDGSTEVLAMSNVSNGRAWYVRTSTTRSCTGLELGSFAVR